MSDPIDRIEAEARQLPLRERARLAQRLLTSLDEDQVEDPSEVEQAWQAEIERRIAAYRSGDSTTVPAVEVFRQARSRLRHG